MLRSRLNAVRSVKMQPIEATVRGLVPVLSGKRRQQQIFAFGDYELLVVTRQVEHAFGHDNQLIILQNPA